MAKTETIKYELLTPRERLALVTDFLRSIESEHYRLTLLNPVDPSKDDRLVAATAELKRLQAEYDDATAGVAAESDGS